MSLDWFQIVGALAGIAGAFKLGGVKKRDRFIGFVFFAISNAFLIAWAIQQQAPWFLIMQLCFVATTARGLWQTRASKDSCP